MTSENGTFVVEQSGERMVVVFRDWHSSETMFFLPGADGLVAGIRKQLDRLVSQHQTRVLAIDMGPVGRVPSSFLGGLSPRRGGLKIELLHPNNAVRLTLETTNLNRLFTVLD